MIRNTIDTNLKLWFTNTMSYEMSMYFRLVLTRKSADIDVIQGSFGIESVSFLEHKLMCCSFIYLQRRREQCL